MEQRQKPETTHPLEELVEKPAKIITTDGRVFVGILRGLDQALNCILTHAEERQFSEQGTKAHQLGTYFVRGDSIVLLGEFNETEEEQEAAMSVKCLPLNSL